jgi:predicted DNA-binding antitoxin AbrB/MazE fold protein
VDIRYTDDWLESLTERLIMAITVEAVYEGGVLKPNQPLPFKEHETVQVTVSSPRSSLLDAAGILGFKGTVEEADYFALDKDLEYPPPPEEA